MNESFPTVSVVLPTYNRANLLPRSIRSVLDQSYVDFELLVVDDASSDDTQKVIQSFSDARIRSFQHEITRGGSAARNTGIAASRGEFIAFLDDDDEWLPHHLQTVMQAIQALGPEWGVVYTGKIAVSSYERKQEYPPQWKGWIFKELFLYGSVGTSTVLVRRACFDKVGVFDPEFPRHQDWEMHLRTAREYKYYPIQNVSVVKNNVNSGPSLESVIKCKDLIVKKFYQEYVQLSWINRRRFLAKSQIDLAKVSIRANRVLLGIGYIAKASFYYPLFIKHIASSIKLLFCRAIR